MIKKIIKKIEYSIKTSKIYNLDAHFEKMREGRGIYSVRDNRYHLIEALNWLKRGQDATPDGGVARGYSVAWNPYFQSKGWQPSYPETTGYIIPTFFDCAEYVNDHDLHQRAVALAKWEIDVQMKNGAVRGGVVDDGKPIPAVFCTGQVILGWVRAYQETNDISFMSAAKKAAEFLLEVQNEEGTFIEHRKYKYANRSTTAYHTRVAWPLIHLGKIINKEEYIQAGVKNIAFNLGYQEKNGWFKNNCLGNAEQPLLHTICYAGRGILEAGLLLDNQNFLEAAKCMADNLLLVLKTNGYLPGRLNKDWKSSDRWSCLTGDAQLSIILLKLYQETGNNDYLIGARKIIEFLKSTQNCSSSDLGLRGGIKGSYPFSGMYGQFEILNWATKFYVDGLLLDDLIQEYKHLSIKNPTPEGPVLV